MRWLSLIILGSYIASAGAQEAPPVTLVFPNVVVHVEDVHSMSDLQQKLKPALSHCPPPKAEERNSRAYTDDVTPDSPPLLNIDDPHVVDACDIEWNVYAELDLSHEEAVSSVHNDMNLGIGNGVQLKVEFAQTSSKTHADHSTESGLSDVSVGVKWMFKNSEEQGLAMAIYPQILARGELGEKGQVITIPLLVSKAFKAGDRPAAISGNVGYDIGINGQPSDWTAAVGAGIAITPVTAAFLAASQQQFFDSGRHRLVQIQIGVSRALAKNLKIYAMAGRSFEMIENRTFTHTSWDAGVRYVIHLRPQSRRTSRD